MWKITFLLAVISATCKGESGGGEVVLLNCDHPLRVLQPELFTHCSTCFYGQWSSWYRIGHSVSSSQCNSGYAYQVERTRKDSYGKCQEESQQQYQCEPTTEEKAEILIVALGLVEEQPLTTNRYLGCPTCSVVAPPPCPSGQICSGNLSYRRSAATKLPTEETPDDEGAVFAELDENIVPMPFDLDKELSHIKAHHQKQQGSYRKDKYVLNILDSSGSIGETNFKKMTNVTAEFSRFYCTGTKIAVMSYSSNVYNNYCFNCDQTDTYLRYNTILNIPFHNALTASGDAIHCACDYMLNSPCGFPRTTGQNAPNLGVVFITDGHSNRGRDVCTAANCWSKFHNIIVFPIGIGNRVNYTELDCIKGSVTNGISGFNLRDFDELLKLLRKVKKKGKCI